MLSLYHPSRDCQALLQLLSFGQKLACEATLLPSDSLLPAKLQMETAIEMTLAYLRQYSNTSH